MNLRKFSALFVSLAITTFSGGTPLWAQTVQAVRVAPVGAPSGAAAAAANVGPSLSLSPVASVSVGLSAIGTPQIVPIHGSIGTLGLLPATQIQSRAAAVGSEAARTAEAAATIVPVSPAQRLSLSPSPAKRERAGVRADSRSLASFVTAAALSAKVSTPKAGASVNGELSAFYDGSAVLRGNVEAVGTGQASRLTPQKLSRASLRSEERTAAETPPAPRSSFSRTFKVGAVGAALMLFVSEVIPEAAAAFFKYAPHPNYQAPGMEVQSVFGAIALMTVLSILAPISEEAIFRGGLMRWLRAKTGRFAGEIGSFWIPALVSSVVFTLLHETADPVLIAARVLGALVLARVYYKEGVLASMVTHGVFNGILGLALIAGAFHLPMAGAIGLGASAVSTLIWAVRSLWKERAARASGAVVPVGMTPAIARTLATVLFVGTALVAMWGGLSLAVGGGIIWIPAAFGLRYWARKREEAAG
ncbi:MAG: CPBP family intramembrane metalloprotease [Elusimicrobia bacterium]|nr:CPBP family intramembrane metalloprotease [Elusimicrobiota bacterium]